MANIWASASSTGTALALPEDLASLVAAADDPRACRRAYAEVVVALPQRDYQLRAEAETLLREEPALEELRHPLNRSDTRRFSRLVDGILEEDWVRHGFQAEERRKPEWRKREPARG